MVGGGTLPMLAYITYSWQQCSGTAPFSIVGARAGAALKLNIELNHLFWRNPQLHARKICIHPVVVRCIHCPLRYNVRMHDGYPRIYFIVAKIPKIIGLTLSQNP
jgi:hypothetical protein